MLSLLLKCACSGKQAHSMPKLMQATLIKLNNNEQYKGTRVKGGLIEKKEGFIPSKRGMTEDNEGENIQNILHVIIHMYTKSSKIN